MHTISFQRTLLSSDEPSVNSLNEDSFNILLFGGLDQYGLVYTMMKVSIDLKTNSVLTLEDLNFEKSLSDNNFDSLHNSLFVINEENDLVLFLDLYSDKSSRSKLNLTSLSFNDQHPVCLVVEQQMQALMMAAEKQQRHSNSDTVDADSEQSSIPSFIDYPNGNRYEGELVVINNTSSSSSTISYSREGNGRFTENNGIEFNGIWKSDKRNGFGRIFLPQNLGSFSGEFIDDVINGQGEIEVNPGCSGFPFIEKMYPYSDLGFIYKGDFHCGLFDGYGWLQSPHMNYEGYWNAGKMHGQGKLVKSPGFVYEGVFDNGLKHDLNAVCIYADGSKYIGPFRSDKRNGKGVYITAGGQSVYTGKWVGDKKCGMGDWKLSSGDRYVGLFTDDFPHGFGTMQYKNGSKYTGDWKYGKRDGVGKYVASDGTIKSGVFKKDLYQPQ